MSRSERRTASVARVESPDDATPKGNMVLTGLVRTSRGYAVATAELAPDGSVVSVKMGLSQADKRYPAGEHKRMLAPLANRAGM